MEKKLNLSDLKKQNSRFWSKVTLDPSGCWMWNAASDPHRYGAFRVLGKNIKAHRYSWAEINGPVPKNKHILHKCDTPACCNPKHLFIGTHQDNMADMYKKNRRKPAIGSKASKAKLTEAQIPTIRILYKQGISSRKLANQFNVSRTTILELVRGNTWTHI